MIIVIGDTRKNLPRVRIRAGWEGHGKTGVILDSIVNIEGMEWAPILWDGEEDPDWHKVMGLEKLTMHWGSL